MNSLSSPGTNLSLLGYSSKREYFGGDAIVFRQVDTYNYEYVVLDLANSTAQALSTSIRTAINAEIAIFSGDVTIRGLDIPASYEITQDQIRTAKYNISVEVRNSIGSQDTNYYNGLSYVTKTGYLKINTFSENFSFENSEDSQKFNHTANFELRSGDRSTAQEIASGILRGSEPNLGIHVLSGYLSLYNDASSQNYYTETYDSLKNSYGFQKTKTLYKASGTDYTYLTNTRFDYNDGTSTISDEVKVKGKKSFEKAKEGLDTLIASSYQRSNLIYNSYKNFSNMGGAGTLFATPLKTVKKYNPQGLSAEGSINFSDNPLYKSNYKQDQIINLSQDVNGIVKVSNQYSFTLLDNITGNMDLLYSDYFKTQSDSSLADASGYYTACHYYRTPYLVSISAKSPMRKRNFSVEYEYSDDVRYNVTLSTQAGVPVAFQNVDYKFTDSKPKDTITEYKVINKPQTLINYAYQQIPGTKTITLTAIRSRPAGNQLVSLTLPTAEVGALYFKALNILSSSFVQLNGLNYYLSNLSFSINGENKMELSAAISYTKKKYV